MKKENVCIIIADSNGGYPVPASKGGAVSSLVEQLVRQNEKKRLVNMTVISVYDSDAERLSKKYPHIKFTYIKPNKLICTMDRLFFGFVGSVLKKTKAASYKSIFSLLYFIKKTSKTLKNSTFDKVVLENNIPMAWAIRLSRYKGEYYYHFHNVPRINARCKAVFNNCTGFLCVSDFVADEIASKNNAIGPQAKSKIKTLYNCIDTKQFRPIHDAEVLRDIKRSYGIKDNEKVILFAGRLSKEKGIDKLLLALDGLKTERFKVLIIGSYVHNAEFMDEYQEYIHKLAEKYRDKVVFTGYIAQEKLPLLYNIADVAVLPSMWDEPAGLTMIEAMACGTPVITTKSGGIPEYVKNGGIILERNHDIVKILSYQMNKMLESTESADEMSVKGMKRINDTFSTKVYLENFIKSLR